MEYLTHEIIFNDNETTGKVRMTEGEAREALDLWGQFKPVTVPNTCDPNRSMRYMNPRNIIEIKRIATEGGVKGALKGKDPEDYEGMYVLNKTKRNALN